MDDDAPQASAGLGQSAPDVPQDQPQVWNPGVIPPGVPPGLNLPDDLANYTVQGIPGYPVPTIGQLINKARSADFFFDIQYYDQYGSDGYNGVDVVYPGQGAADLDHVIRMFSRYRRIKVRLDLGYGQTAAQYGVSLSDVQELKALYVFFYGNTEKPNIYGIDQYTLNGVAPPPWNDAGR